MVMQDPKRHEETNIMWSEQLAGPLADQHARDLRVATRSARGMQDGRGGMAARLWDRVRRTQSNGAGATADLDRVTIRRSRPGDRVALERLAQLDSRRLAEGQLLVAEVDGELRAALPVAGGAAIADPFTPNAALVSLLVLRARQLASADAAFSASATATASARVTATARSAAAGR
jgi:hypothetical protein